MGSGSKVPIPEKVVQDSSTGLRPVQYECQRLLPHPLGHRHQVRQQCGFLSHGARLLCQVFYGLFVGQRYIRDELIEHVKAMSPHIGVRSRGLWQYDLRCLGSGLPILHRSWVRVRVPSAAIAALKILHVRSSVVRSKAHVEKTPRRAPPPLSGVAASDISIQCETRSGRKHSTELLEEVGRPLVPRHRQLQLVGGGGQGGGGIRDRRLL